MEDTVTVKLNQQQMDVLTGLIDLALKSGGIQTLGQANLIMGLLQQAVVQKQMQAQADTAQQPETGEGAA